MPKGKTTNLTLQSYGEMKSSGMSRDAMAQKLGLSPTAISKFCSRHKAELAGDPVGINHAMPSPTDPDTIDKLLKMNLHLTNQIERIVKAIDKTSSKEGTKLVEVLIKCLGESRQQHLALQNITSILMDQRIIYKFFGGIADAIRAEAPKSVRDKIFQRILTLRNAYSETAEVQSAMKE